MKTPIDEIISEASRLGVGIALAPDDYLEVFPAAKVPRDFLAAVRARKTELRAFLAARAPWLHVAKQILLGEFNGCDGSTRQKLADGLHSVPHPLARRALEILEEASRQ